MNFSNTYEILIKSVPFILLTIALLYSIFNLKDITSFDKNLKSSESEIEQFSSIREVISPKGILNVNGWSTNPAGFNYNSEYVKASSTILKEINPIRYKKWETYVFSSKNYIFTITNFDYTYCGGYYVQFTDYKGKPKSAFFHSFLNRPVILDNCNDSCNSVQWDKPNENTTGLKSFDVFKSTVNNHRIKFIIDENNINIDLNVRIQTSRPDANSIVNITPISKDTSLNALNTITNLFIPKGPIKINGKILKTDDFRVTYKSGRGIFPIRMESFWANGNGLTNKNLRIGFNFGHGFSHPDSSLHTEDMFNCEGVVFKLKSVKTELPKNYEDNLFDDYTQIRIYNEKIDGENHCNITFKILKRNIDSNLTFYILRSHINSNYGSFKGRCVTNKGFFYEFENVYGLAETKTDIW